MRFNGFENRASAINWLEGSRNNGGIVRMCSLIFRVVFRSMRKNVMRKESKSREGYIALEKFLPIYVHITQAHESIVEI